ncbi:MAG: YCF48-related protein [Gammaproteobacteria bacterium]
MGRIVGRVVPNIGILLLAALLSSGIHAQESGDIPEPQSSVIMPMATEALLLDATRIDEKIVAVGDFGIVLTSTDDGETWQQSQVPTRSMLTGVWFHDSNLGWAVGHDAVVLKTTDGGATWELVNYQPELLLPLFDVWFADPSTGLAVGAYGFVLKTSDGGDTWVEGTLNAVPLTEAEEETADQVSESGGEEDEPFWEEDFSTGIDFHLNKIIEGSDGRLYVAAEAGNIYRSDDRGETWVSLPSDYTGSYFGALTLPDDDLLIFGLRGNMFRSSDGGLAWRQIKTPVETSLNEGDIMADGAIAVVGMSGTVLVSRDGGETFELVQREDRKSMTSVLATGTGGLILFGEGGIVRMESGDL